MLSSSIWPLRLMSIMLKLFGSLLYVEQPFAGICTFVDDVAWVDFQIFHNAIKSHLFWLFCSILAHCIFSAFTLGLPELLSLLFFTNPRKKKSCRSRFVCYLPYPMTKILEEVGRIIIKRFESLGGNREEQIC